VDDPKMVSRNAGRAWKFVEGITELQNNDDGVLPLTVESIFFTAERLMATQERFRAVGHPSHVDIGFHYTNSKNMEQIRVHGLLSRLERTAAGIREIKFIID